MRMSIRNLLNILKSSVARKNSFIADVLIIVSGSAFGQILTIIMTPALTRIYSPEHFGIFGVYMAFSTILASVYTMRYEAAIPIPKSGKEAHALFLASLIISTFFVGISLLVVLLYSEYLNEIFDFPSNAWLWVPLGAYSFAVVQSFSFFAIRTGAFSAISISKVVQGISTVVIQLVIGLYRISLGLLIGDLAGKLFAIGIYYIYARANFALLPYSFTMSDILRSAFRYWKFPVFSAISSMINRMGLQLPQIFIASQFGAVEAGWFLLAQRILGGPTTLLGQAISNVFINRIAKIRRDNPTHAVKYYLAVLYKLSLIGAMILVASYILSYMIEMLFGPQWTGAGLVIRITGPMYATRFVFFPTSQILTIFEKQEWQFVWDLLRLILVLLAFAFSKAIGYGLEETLVLLASASITAYLLLGIMTVKVLGNR